MTSESGGSDGEASEPVAVETYEQRFTVPLLKDAMIFVRRPVSTPPPDGTLCLVDSGCQRFTAYPTAGVYQDGKWTNGKGRELKRAPTHWTEMEPRNDKP